MHFVSHALEILRHLDVHLAQLARDYGPWIYGILFAIIFAETGLVVAPFLPGDSLLFAAGALAATGEMNVVFLWLTLLLAALLGDNVNYWVGHTVGRSVFKEDARILKKAYLVKTEGFYEKYGGKTLILARFMPIVRTYAPFVAGASRMAYPRFLMYSVLGALVWVTAFVFLGYFFGNIPWIKHNFEYAVLAIVLLSVVPAVLEFVKHRRAGKAA